MMKLFKYSGCKSKLIPHYRRPPAGTLRVVEPYLGSGAYILSTELPGLGYEINDEVVSLWRWLKSTNEEDLLRLARVVDELRSAKEKPDVRELGLDLGRQTYVRLSAASIVTGQLKSWKLYPKHKLPIEKTIECLPRLNDIEVVHGSANEYVHREGDLLFIDPPYVGTDGGYMGEQGKRNHGSAYLPEDTIHLISSTTNPIIFTYGDGAPEIFRDFVWSPVKTMKVPNMRSGGTTDRTEWVSYINW